jgi:hypothetical protein
MPRWCKFGVANESVVSRCAQQWKPVSKLKANITLFYNTGNSKLKKTEEFLPA